MGISAGAMLVLHPWRRTPGLGAIGAILEEFGSYSDQVFSSIDALCRCQGAAAWGFEGWESRWKHANRLADASRPLQTGQDDLASWHNIELFRCCCCAA